VEKILVVGAEIYSRSEISAISVRCRLSYIAINLSHRLGSQYIGWTASKKRSRRFPTVIDRQVLSTKTSSVTPNVYLHLPSKDWCYRWWPSVQRQRLSMGHTCPAPPRRNSGQRHCQQRITSKPQPNQPAALRPLPLRLVNPNQGVLRCEQQCTPN
jgi:hypothetical protein